jgi:guanylate kinase
VFLVPPSWDELDRRLSVRGTEPRDVIEARLARARVELAAESEFDKVIVNDDVGRAAAELVSLIEAACAKHDQPDRQES